MKKLVSFAFSLSVVLFCGLTTAEAKERNLNHLGHHRHEAVDCWREEGRLVLDYDGRYFGGWHTLSIGDDLQRYCDVVPAELQLKGVVLVAKSNLGVGYAYLLENYHKSHKVRISGDPDFWGPYGFDRVLFPLRGEYKQGPMYFKLRGEFRVDRVFFLLKE
jgi:hypothetical protein